MNPLAPAELNLNPLNLINKLILNSYQPNTCFSQVYGHAPSCVDTQAAGVIETVVAVMRAQPTDANAQEQGCGALYNLVYDCTPVNLEAARAVGAVDAVANAMGAHRRAQISRLSPEQ